MPAAKKPQPEPKNKPAHEISINGIRASIWKNETDKGAWLNTTFERSHKDGEEWKTSNSFGRADLLVVAHISTEAFQWIAEQTMK